MIPAAGTRDRALYQAKRQGRNRVGGERPPLKLASSHGAVAAPAASP